MKFDFKYITLILVFTLHTLSYSQQTLDDLNYTKINKKSIHKYFDKLKSDNKHYFSDLNPSWISGDNLSSFKKDEMTFILNGNITEVWSKYLAVNPSKVWNGSNISFGVLLQKSPDKIFYNGDSIQAFSVGQVYFLNLKLLCGILNIPVAFEIITKDNEDKLIEFSYIKGNKSEGVQQIKFTTLNENLVKITHSSYFKSNSKFRDHYLYPTFHHLFIKEFHAKIKHLTYN